MGAFAVLGGIWEACSPPTGPGAGQADARGADGECGQAGITARRITAW